MSVEQIDRKAACKFYGYDDEADLVYWGNVSKHSDVERLAEAFANHRQTPADPGFAAGVAAAAKVADICARGYADPPVGLINGACVEACEIVASAIRGLKPRQRDQRPKSR